MPQMSPLNWLLLYFYTLMILLIINILMNYLFILDSLNKKDLKNKEVKILYKWLW